MSGNVFAICAIRDEGGHHLSNARRGIEGNVKYCNVVEGTNVKLLG